MRATDNLMLVLNPVLKVLINSLAFISPLLALTFGILVILPWQAKRAARRLLRMLRQIQATSPKTAVTTQELGIPEHTFFTFRLLRNFGREGLSLLAAYGAVQLTTDNRYYLVEDRVAQLPFMALRRVRRDRRPVA